MRTAARIFEMLQGVFLPSLVALPFLATQIPFDALDDRMQATTFRYAGGWLAVLAVVVFVTFFARRWWGSHRARAWGLIGGAVATPFLLIGLFLLWVTLFNVRLFVQ